ESTSALADRVSVSCRSAGPCGPNWTAPAGTAQRLPTLEARRNCAYRKSHSAVFTNVTLFYKRECQEKKPLPRLEGAKKFFLTSSPCIDVRIRDFSDSPDSSCWRNDVHRFLMHQAVGL